MQTSEFSSFLDAARAQTEPQRLLFVFAVAELPGKVSPGQIRRFEAGRGGALAPVMCVDKDIEELSDFASLVAESEQTGQPWDMVFIAALAGGASAAPTRIEVDRALRGMIDALHRGAVDRYLAYDRQGQAVRFL